MQLLRRHSSPADRRRSRPSPVVGDGRSIPFTWPNETEPAAATIACLVRQGVLVDELRMLAHALGDRNVRGVNVGRTVGRTSGVAGSAIVDVAFGDHDRTESVVFVPGGIGVLDAITDDELLHWLEASIRHAEWVITSSTGSLLVAATGALAGRSASTHWLATNALADLGADSTGERMTVAGNVITCSGQSTIAAAVELALNSVASEFLTPTGERVSDAAWRRPAS